MSHSRSRAGQSSWRRVRFYHCYAADETWHKTCGTDLGPGQPSGVPGAASKATPPHPASLMHVQVAADGVMTGNGMG